MTKFIFNDGGRKAAGFKRKNAGDCVCRAIAIAADLPYAEVHKALSEGNYSQRKSKRCKSMSNKGADSGVYTRRKWFKDYMMSLGCKWVPTMGIGTGCKVHMKADELPKGKIICRLTRHYSAMIDGVINDTYDPSREGTRCVYGYWIK